MNERIKEFIKKSRVKNYEIAGRIGVSEFTFSRWFRHQMTAEQEAKIFTAIETIKKEEAK